MGKWDNIIIWKTTDKISACIGGIHPGTVLSDHADPTADMAIANIIREEKRKQAKSDAGRNAGRNAAKSDVCGKRYREKAAKGHARHGMVSKAENGKGGSVNEGVGDRK